MYPVTRLISSSVRAFFAPTVPMNSMVETDFYCRPWDVDMFLEMNNGRILTLYDLGRFDLAIRTGFAKVLKEQAWGLVVAGSSIRYRRRIRMFHKVTMRTQIVGFDERWCYITQSMWVAGNPTSSALLRTGITKVGKTLPSQTVLDAMGLSDWKLEPQGWVRAWIDSEALRDWPP